MVPDETEMVLKNNITAMSVLSYMLIQLNSKNVMHM